MALLELKLFLCQVWAVYLGIELRLLLRSMDPPWKGRKDFDKQAIHHDIIYIKFRLVVLH